MGFRLRLGKIIDADGAALVEKEKKKWRDMLYRLLDITWHFVATRQSSLNKGNFLKLVHMLPKYDPSAEKTFNKINEKC